MEVGEGMGAREQWGTKGTVHEQPGTEVDHSCHSWRVPSKWRWGHKGEVLCIECTVTRARIHVG
jgi:hypothetical protein